MFDNLKYIMDPLDNSTAFWTIWEKQDFHIFLR